MKNRSGLRRIWSVILLFAILSALFGCASPGGRGTDDTEAAGTVAEGSEPLMQADSVQASPEAEAGGEGNGDSASGPSETAVPTPEYTAEGLEAAAKDGEPGESGDSGGITPYQFLNLICGNAEELSFTYTAEPADAGGTGLVIFQKAGDSSVASFSAKNRNGVPVSVRELETGGKVYYIMDDIKAVQTYAAPAEDFLLYRMMLAANNAPDSVLAQDGYELYEYSLPFEQDETERVTYRFFMQGGVLKKLTVESGGASAVSYEFAGFRQELIDSAAFDCPADYREETHGYAYSGDSAPPWWDTGEGE